MNSAQAMFFQELLYNFDYSIDSNYRTQEKVFLDMQDSLINNKHNPLGKCTQISTYTEKIGEDIGMKIDSVSEMLHVYNIIDTKRGLAVIDSSNLVRLENNYDIEEILKI